VNDRARALTTVVTGGAVALALTALVFAVVPAASGAARIASLALSGVLGLIAWGTVRQARERDLLADGLASANERIVLADDAATAAATALEFLSDAIRIDLGSVLVLRGARLAPLAVTGELSTTPASFAETGVPYEPGPLRDAWRDGRSIFSSTGASRTPAPNRHTPPLGATSSAVVPVPDAAGTTRALLVLATGGAPMAWSEQDRRRVSGVALVLGAALQRSHLERQLHEMRDVLRAVAQADDPHEAYDRAVNAAVRVIPGAEAATLLVRNEEGRYRFVAAEGYDLAELVAMGDFDEEVTRAWYGLGRKPFERGVPRLLRGSEIAPHSYATTHGDAQGDTLLAAGRVGELQASICVPVVAAGEVLGTLNVDNMSLEETFGDAEMDLAQAFGQQMGVLFRQTQTREALARAATTDSVTGLPNREGFNRRAPEYLARARRRDESVHLVMMDLDGFKRVNDRLGHRAGDVALQRVASALRATSRAGDGLFRWGGDEFVLLLAGGSKAEAGIAADRHADAIASVRVGGMSMSTSVGIASWPDDARDTEELLHRADDRMYRHKRRAGPATDEASPQSGTSSAASEDEDDASDAS